ncbi:MAG: hypothetical protein U9Q85_00360 [Patescibacteria group bacterium]|nr:hypothetical protein [Patescibacteria group bacterium]
MRKNNFFDALFAVLVMVSMVAMYAFIPGVSAAGMDSAKTTLSDSDLGVTATSTIVIDLNNSNPLTQDQMIRVTFDSNFSDLVADMPITCPDNMSASTTYTSASNEIVECTVDAGLFVAATSTQTIIVGNHTNPGSENASGYDVAISSHDTYASGNAEIDYASTKVYIIDDVLVSARVPASLTFSVDGIGPNSSRNSIDVVTLSGTSTATTIPFGTLSTAASSTFGQELSVSTNASNGFTVTVQQTAELTNGAGDTINSFDNQADGSGTVSPTGWNAPTASFGSAETYGHMGVTADDTTNMTTDYNSGKSYVGLNGTDTAQVMSHDGPSNGTGEGQGIAGAFYSIEISDLQEAGDYTTYLTYVCTPTY